MATIVNVNGNKKVVDTKVETHRKDLNWIEDYYNNGGDPVGRQEFQNYIEDLNKLYERCKDILNKLFEFDKYDKKDILSNKVACIVLCNQERYLKYPKHSDWKAIDDWSDKDMVCNMKLNIEDITSKCEVITKELLNAYLDYLYDIKKAEAEDAKKSKEIFDMQQEQAKTYFQGGSTQKLAREGIRKI